MNKITIAFDIDGTLRDNSKDNSLHPMLDENKSPMLAENEAPIANEEIRSLLIILSKFKNVKILVWSGGGEEYARNICLALGLSKYVDQYASKCITEEDRMGVRQAHPDLRVDIAIDDIQDCVLGGVNLIVKQK